MPHLFVIVVLVSLSLASGSGLEAVASGGPGDAGTELVRTWSDGLFPAATAPWARAAVFLCPFLAIAVAAWSVVRLCVRRLDRTGRVGAVRLSARTIAAARLAALLWHLISVFVVGSLGLVRALVGDLVILDELLAAAPALAVLLWTYRLSHPIERRVRDAMLIRALDEGRPVYAFPTPWRFVLSTARNNLAIMFVPLVLILTWSDALDRLLPLIDWPGLTADAPDFVRAGGPAAFRLAGSIAVFALVPPLMTRVWDTVPIPEGELRWGLERLAREHRVRLRRFLIWRTGGSMLNGAVIGLLPRLRYIVLTDSLLENLTEPEVEAVAAHEVAHVRKHHMIWLALAVLGSALLFGEGAALGLYRLGWPDAVVSWSSAVVALVSVLLVLGVVSRRFEWQADAFAARHLSMADTSEPRIGPDRAVTDSGARAMSSALARVARLNGMPEKRFTWRHGSIATRRKRLTALVGAPVGRMPIDRRVRTMKALILIGFAGGVWLLVAGFAGVWPYAEAIPVD